jgi:hypothetical protein
MHFSELQGISKAAVEGFYMITESLAKGTYTIQYKSSLILDSSLIVLTTCILRKVIKSITIMILRNIEQYHNLTFQHQ